MIRRCPSCGAAMRYARNVSPGEEQNANERAPAAILDCTACRMRLVLEGTNRHPRHAQTRLPDQSVFDVTPTPHRSNER